MRVFYTVIIIICTTLFGFGGTVEDAVQVLSSHSYNKLVQFEKKLSKQSKNEASFTHFEDRKRQIIGKYQELKFGLEYNLICNAILLGDTIIYYALNRTSQGAVAKELGKYRDEARLSALNTAYINFYKKGLSINELFLNIRYGEHCGYVGANPEHKTLLDGMVLKKDIGELEYWLASENLEKQIYAIEGFFQLKKRGYKVTAEQLRLINFIKAKHEFVATCSGCTSMPNSVQTVTEDFVF